MNALQLYMDNLRNVMLRKQIAEEYIQYDFINISSKTQNQGTPLVVQLRIHLVMQGMQVWSLVGELDPHMPWSNKAPVPQGQSLHAATKNWCREINKH